tara:strand:- start:348 stop:458 length:111 start_codon:yes stop_codon:yes gene_type:complete
MMKSEVVQQLMVFPLLGLLFHDVILVVLDFRLPPAA